jgi:hypothetical protein
MHVSCFVHHIASFAAHSFCSVECLSIRQTACPIDCVALKCSLGRFRAGTLSLGEHQKTKFQAGQMFPRSTPVKRLNGSFVSRSLVSTATGFPKITEETHFPGSRTDRLRCQGTGHALRLSFTHFRNCGTSSPLTCQLQGALYQASVVGGRHSGTDMWASAEILASLMFDTEACCA